MDFYIYKITNSLNEKIYIGVTKQSIEKRFVQHSTASTSLGNAMRDCGLENFTIEIIETCQSLEAAHERERFWIKVLKSKIPCGYNQSDGGEGGYTRKLSEKNFRTKLSTEKSVMTIAESLRRFRKEFHLTQKDIAEILNTTPQNVYRFEKVDSAISAESVVRIADTLNVSTDYLLGRIDTPKLDNPISKESKGADAEIVKMAIDLLNKSLRH